MITGHPLEHVINGPAHHTLHHLYFTVNYGQVHTLSLAPPLSAYHFSAVLYMGRSGRWFLSPARVPSRPTPRGRKGKVALSVAPIDCINSSY